MRIAICLGVGLFTAVGVSVAAIEVTSGEPAPTSKKSLGFVLTDWTPAYYATQKLEEMCPQGYSPSNKNNWQQEKPTKELREAHGRMAARLNPDEDPPGNNGPNNEPFADTRLRGPEGQDVVYNATLVKDPLPLHEVQSKISHGFNLDGRTDGSATAKTCKHADFVSPDGEAGIDNQLYRVEGCSFDWQQTGSNRNFFTGQFRELGANRLLIEVTDVDSEVNDDHVEVAFYKGVDGLVDSGGKWVPWMPYRIDVRFPRYTGKTTGKIVSSVLYIEPFDHRIPTFQIVVPGERLLRDMHLRLKITEEGGEGEIGGYENLREFWRLYQNSWGFTTTGTHGWSPPALYEALHRLADGYPDQKTGRCTAISAAYSIKAVKAFIVTPGEDDPLVIDTKLPMAVIR